MRHMILVWSMFLGLITAASAEYTDQMTVVPAGTFIMGQKYTYCGLDEHEVTLTRDFYLSRREVTNLEYLEAVQWAYNHGYVTATTSSVRDNLDGSTEELLDLDPDYAEIQFLDAGGGIFYLRESYGGLLAYPDGYDPSKHPVMEVTWYGAVRFCDWLSLQEGLPRPYAHTGDWKCNNGDPYGASGYLLPTDAEWEYAAQYDDERIYPWGHEEPDCSRANFDPGPACVSWTSPVGSYPDAPEILGLSDMAGNLYEWCNDWHVCDLGTAPQTDPPGPLNGTCRMLRSGCWADFPGFLRCANRYDLSLPHYSNIWMGFRAARTVSASRVKTRPAHDHSQLVLDINQPNPFTALTQITYAIPNAAAGSTVLLAIYNAAGRRIRTLVGAEQQAGQRVVSWDGADNAGRQVEGGIYFYRLRAGGQTVTRRMLLVK